VGNDVDLTNKALLLVPLVQLSVPLVVILLPLFLADVDGDITYISLIPPLPWMMHPHLQAVQLMLLLTDEIVTPCHGMVEVAFTPSSSSQSGHSLSYSLGVSNSTDLSAYPPPAPPSPRLLRKQLVSERVYERPSEPPLAASPP